MNYWLLLHSIPGMGTATFNKLLKKFSSPEKVFKTTRDELLSIPGISNTLIDLILAPPLIGEVKRVEKELKKRQFKILTIQNNNYPSLLKKTGNPPPIIYIYGELNTAKNIAIIGARLASRKGLRIASEFAESLASYGFTIISGYAKGVDTYAHLGAIAGNGKTVMVLPMGALNFVVHKELFNMREKLFLNSTIISQFFPLAGWSTGQAMVRNRMISELSMAVFVAEAGAKGGTVSTTTWAKKLNKQIFIYRHTSGRRTKEILELGAIPVESPEEIRKILE